VNCKIIDTKKLLALDQRGRGTRLSCGEFRTASSGTNIAQRETERDFYFVPMHYDRLTNRYVEDRRA